MWQMVQDNMQVSHVHMEWSWTNKQLTVICIREGGMGIKSTVKHTNTKNVLRKKGKLKLFLIVNLMVVVLHTLVRTVAATVMSKQTGVTQGSTMQIFNGMFLI